MPFLDPRIICETSTVTHGDMNCIDTLPEVVLKNRADFLTAFHISTEAYIPMACNHGTTVVSVTKNDIPKKNALGVLNGIPAEVLVTQESGLALFLLTADCLPVCLFDPHTNTLALAHISRSTFEQDLLEKTITYLQHGYGVQPQNLLIEIGPHIHKNSYRFPLPLMYSHLKLVPYMETAENIVSIDLTKACTDTLISLGTPEANIRVSETDTATAEQCFSHFAMKQKGEKATVRMATVCMMHP